MEYRYEYYLKFNLKKIKEYNIVYKDYNKIEVLQ